MDLPPAADLVLAEMAKLEHDPFQGVTERRVLPDELTSSDMEIAASKEALQRSGIKASEIGMVLSQTTVPDYISCPTAAVVHHALGIPASCLSAGVEAACNGFHQQLALAEGMIRSGLIRYALLVQSSAFNRVLRSQDNMSAWYSDAASAVVVGPAQNGGLLGRAHRTDGDYYRGLVIGVPGKRWHSGEAPYGYAEDRSLSRKMLLSMGHIGRDVVLAAVEQAGVSASEVNVLAAHQGASWIGDVIKQHAGLEGARVMNSFPWTGSLGSANVPFLLNLAEKDGHLRPGNLVATFAGGSGITYAGTVIRWGV